jgi:hypothetical protein
VCDTVCFADKVVPPCGENLRVAPVEVKAVCRRHAAGPTLTGQSCRVGHSCRKCIHNAVYAMSARHGPPQSLDVAPFTQFRAFVVSHNNAVRHEYLDLVGYCRENWLQKWPAHKRHAIARSKWLDRVRPDWVLNMVKIENSSERPSKPRCIQYYPNLATQAKFGPEFQALQKAYTKVYQELGDGVKITFASGMNAKELGLWMERALGRCRGKYHIFESDGKTWDGMLSRAHHDLKMFCYSFMDDDFRDFVEQGFDVGGLGRYNEGRLKYRLRGTIKSGHNDTTLGNSLVNAGVAYESMVGMGLNGSILVAGDDLIIVVDGDFDEHELARRCASHGIMPEYRKFDDVQDITFISGMWFPTKDGLVFTPKPGRLLARLFWTTKPPAKRKRQLYNDSIALGLMPVCGGLPVIGAFLRAHYSGGVKRVSLGGYDHWLRKFADETTYDESVVLSYCVRYGVCASDLTALEGRITSRAGQVGVWADPVMEQICRVDLAGLLDRPTVGTAFAGGVHDPRLSVHD